MASETSINTKSKQDSETSSPPIEMYLRINPSLDDKKMYKIVNPETLITFVPSKNKFIPCSRPKISSKTEGKQQIFTKIFESKYSLEDVFEKSMQPPVIDLLLDGKNSTIMNYGMKNIKHTSMLLELSTSKNIITQIIIDLFANINCTELPWYKPTCQGTIVHLDDTACALETAYKKQRNIVEKKNISYFQSSDSNKTKYAVWLSFAQIYDETIYDLFNLKDDKEKYRELKMYVNTNGQSFIHNLTKIYVTSIDEVNDIIKKTLTMCEEPLRQLVSSLSHFIFTIELLQYKKNESPEEVTLSSLTIYDLGSFVHYEQSYKYNKYKIFKTVNTSLLTLNMCLRALSRNQMAPFRQSKITQLCRHVLSGKENLSIIVNVTFEQSLVKKVQRIFNFCDIVRKLNNKNNKLKDAQHNSKIMILKKLVKRLKKEKREILYEKDNCSYELILAKQESEKFQHFVRDEICKWGGSIENVENTTDCFMNNLLQLMCGKVKDAEKKFEEVNKKIHKMSELEEACLYNGFYILRLQRQIQNQKKQLIEVKQYIDNIKNGSINYKEYKSLQSINISIDDNAMDNFLPNNMSISKNSSQARIISPTVNQHEADDWIVIPRPPFIQVALENNDINVKSSDNKSNDDLNIQSTH